MKPKVGDIMVCVTKQRYSPDPKPVITDMVVVKVGRLYFYAVDTKYTDDQRQYHRVEFNLAHNGRGAYPEREGIWGSNYIRQLYTTRYAYTEDLDAIELHDTICEKMRGNKSKRLSLQALREIKAILDREADV